MTILRQWFHGIRLKLLFLILIPCALFVVLSLTSNWALHSQMEKSNHMANKLFPKSQMIMIMRVQANALMRFLWTAEASSGEQALRKEKMLEAQRRLQELHKLAGEFRSQHLTESVREAFTKMEKDIVDMEKPFAEVVRLLEANTEEANHQVHVILVNQLVPEVQDLIEAAMAGSEQVEAEFAEQAKQSTELAALADKALGTVSIVGALGIVIAGLWLGQMLAKRLSEVLKGIVQTEDEVLSVSQQLASASQQVSSGAVEAASALEETVASVEELTSMVKTNSDNAMVASGLSRESLNSGERGEKEIRHMIDVMYEISGSSRKIEEIISVIDDIAFQTNLLALNASVEAARAGEHGRGFAVVAEAVRALSQRSAAAAKDISVLIRTSVEKVSEGEVSAKESGEQLQKILTSIKQMTTLTEEIATASREQAEGISQISKAINELDVSVQQNASASEEVASSSEVMTLQAKSLDQSVEKLSHLITGNAA